MFDLGPGTLGRCIDAGPYKGSPVSLVLGDTYEISHVWGYVPHEGNESSTWADCAVDLAGVERPAPDIAWGLYRFAPLPPVATAQEVNSSKLCPQNQSDGGKR